MKKVKKRRTSVAPDGQLDLAKDFQARTQALRRLQSLRSGKNDHKSKNIPELHNQFKRAQSFKGLTPQFVENTKTMKFYEETLEVIKESYDHFYSPKNVGICSHILHILGQTRSYHQNDFILLPEEKRKERIDYLWKKLRLAVKVEIRFYKALDSYHEKNRWENFDLDVRNMVIDENMEREKYQVEENRQKSIVAWYIFEESHIISKIHRNLVELLTVFVTFLVPLYLVDTDQQEQLKEILLYCDLVWMVGIFMQFFMADTNNLTFRQISKNYLTSGLFMIDIVSTLPTLITNFTGEASFQYACYLKFTRLVRFTVMFMPFKRLMRAVFSKLTQFQIDTSFNFFLIICFTILATHIFACFWISLGNLPTLEQL